MNVNIETSWKEVLQDEFEQAYFRDMAAFLHQRKEEGAVIYPKGRDIFKAFALTPFEQVKVVILGQDPYHGPGQAMGLSFSVPDTVPAPPSLKNIFREIENDLGVRMTGRHNLEKWAAQGVLMLNAVLTVEAGQAGSHGRIGWQTFTDAVIARLSQRRDGLVFLLWGNFARSKKSLIDTSRHLVLEAAHPSPLAGGAFFGCRHFSKTNQWLTSMGKEPIDWTL